MLCLAGFPWRKRREERVFLHPLIRLPFPSPPPAGLPEFLKMLLGGD